MDHFLKICIEFDTVLLLFYVVVFWLQGMGDLSSLTSDGAHTPCIEGEILTTGQLGKSLPISSYAEVDGEEVQEGMMESKGHEAVTNSRRRGMLLAAEMGI